MTVSRRVSWDGKQLAVNGGDVDQPDEALHNSAVVGSGNAPVVVEDPLQGVAVEAPPKGGPGSGIDAWRSYADSLGVAYAEDDTRDDIIAAVEANG